MNCYTAALDEDALLHISGPDSLTFLQGQTTCDTREISRGQARPGAYCTPQGRVVCDFLLLALGEDHYGLRMRRAIRPQAAEVFGKYIVFSRATLDAGRDDWAIQACWGAQAGAALREVFGRAPSARFESVAGPGFVLVQVDSAGEQFECYLEQAGATAWRDRLADAGEKAPASWWGCQQIRAGIGRIEEQTVEEFVPQMLNYDLTGHISFSKGCYTGQEVVARLHYRGTPKRRLYPGRLAQPAEPGAALYRDGEEQAVGNIVNCSCNEAGAYEVLAVAVRSIAGEPLRLADGTALQLAEPPYSLGDDREE